MKKIKKAYKKYKGELVKCDKGLGIVCGHDKQDLIVAVVKGDRGWPYEDINDYDFINKKWKNHKFGYDYLFIDEIKDNIVKIEQSWD